jgi:hypothetical protein
MNQKECILPQKQYLFLFKSASLTIISVLYASYQQYYDISLNAFIVFCTSVNYWRKPMNDWRRTMDKSCLFVYVLYFFYRANNSKYIYLFYNNLIGMIYFYMLSKYFGKKQMYWRSVYSHSMIHFIANLSNILLCSDELCKVFFSVSNNSASNSFPRISCS